MVDDLPRHPDELVQETRLRQQHKIRRRLMVNWMVFGGLWLAAGALWLFLENSNYPYLGFLPWLLFTLTMLFRPYWLPAHDGQVGLSNHQAIRSIWKVCIASIWISGLLLPATRVLPGHFVLPLILWWISIGFYATGVLSKTSVVQYIGLFWFVAATVAYYLTPMAQGCLLLGLGVASSLAAILALSRKRKTY